MTPEQLDDYSGRAFKFAIYPKAGSDIAYPALGLCGETSETYMKLASKSVMTDDILKECGDVLWYCNAVAITCGRTLGAIQIVGGHYGSALDAAGWMFVHAGAIAEQGKKVIRGGEALEGRRDKILHHLGLLLGALLYIIDTMAGTMESVANDNLSKLGDREDRGLIHGDGDNR